MKFGRLLASALGGVVLLVSAGCGPKYPNCEKDEHCKEHNEYCVMGLCRECARTDHCAAKGPCVYCGPEYTCIKPQGAPGDCCTSDLDCKQGKCWKLPGREAGTCAQCGSDADCGANMKCVQGSCVPRGECDASRPCPPGQVCENGVCVAVQCSLDPVYFDFDEYAIRADARDTLNRNYNCLKQRGQGIGLEGNCDARGSDEYNLALGTRRAEAVKKFLQNLGFGGSMTTTSFGEEKANQTCTDEGCWQNDRRVDLKFR